jgi:hypothetical protein
VIGGKDAAAVANAKPAPVASNNLRSLRRCNDIPDPRTKSRNYSTDSKLTGMKGIAFQLPIV